MEFETVIGLEVHAELSTESKAYCGCANKFGSEVNTFCCPVCLAMPGTLPALNEKVVEYAVKMGLALNCKINTISKQDRKNYFYPDLVKGYQISQFDIPICQDGYLDIVVGGESRRIGVTRLHIEEDTGKLIHDSAFAGTLIDFNRCGVPLIEIVSEPDLRSAAEAKAYLETIRSFLIFLGISDAKMQEGSIRCDVNVSVREKGADKLGVRCEMKNVSSFSGAVKAIEYESNRHKSILMSGGTVSQETRKWDESSGTTILMRSKENALDYRYFPEPDLKTLVVPQELIDRLKSQIPEMPNQKAKRYISEYNLGQADAELIAYNTDRAALFEDTLSLRKLSPKSVCNWILTDITRKTNEKGCSAAELGITPAILAEITDLVDSRRISNTSGRIVLEEIIASGGKANAEDIIKEKGLEQISDQSALAAIVDRVLGENQKSVDDYNAGKTNALGFLIGQCMKMSKGQGNPSLMKEMVLAKIVG
ncbi:MAG: Asp-tRNA(Asn)/Glu-tRNA(Gln) amidotransferase subunit GatB [Oscillospiraceae bacterium]|nr:Asp-tRNA(Asn)/Glu-tRNA(Gln) amidotransferase subunit GatB [Oscillospiraceae bacterium]